MSKVKLKNYDDIEKFFIGRLNLNYKKFERPFIIGLNGYPGSGKSTVSKKLSELLDIYVMSSDFVRKFIMDSDVEDKSLEKVREVTNKIFIKRRELLSKHGISFIMDGNIKGVHERVESECKALGYELIIIELKCSDEVCINRLNNRKSSDISDSIDKSNGDIGNYSNVTKDNFMKIKMLKNKETPQEYIYESVDMEKSKEEVNSQLQDIAKRIYDEYII